ncbi:anti-sigma factor family protein [Mangrovibacterium diazotrophicum]|uniref:Putative zinc finger protein n=1 Tax=Mangrovibacterium diazotrophicum TaxID=1261403 RepID=A0A419W539_9BACT|nr:zf-HC2 domain-containing protein [Mangrovibacterium diazotrophicum]RKD90578.1 putative zinc finger protein [Mangrovibacterium diazotrophicum]
MKTMNHHSVRKELIFYLEGSLPEKTREQVAAHLEECGECMTYFLELKSSLLLLDENRTQDPGPYFYTGVKNRIDARRSVSGVRWQRVLQPALIVLLLAVGIRFGIWVGDHARADLASTEQAVLVPFDDLSEEPIEEFLLNFE